MINRYSLLMPILACAFAAAVTGSVFAQSAALAGSEPSTPSGSTGTSGPSAIATFNQLGPENNALAARTGTWKVTETVWAAPDTKPQVTHGLVAHRRMVGTMLEETLRNGEDANGSILRTDYQTFNRVEGRWDYVSMDTRAPVGIMPAWSFGAEQPDAIRVTFEPFAWVGSGQKVSGQMLRMQQVFIRLGLNHDRKDQYFLMADGTGKSWLAHRYDYERQP